MSTWPFQYSQDLGRPGRLCEGGAIAARHRFTQRDPAPFLVEDDNLLFGRFGLRARVRTVKESRESIEQGQKVVDVDESVPAARCDVGVRTLARFDEFEKYASQVIDIDVPVAGEWIDIGV